MSETLEPETGEMIVKRVSVPIGLEELMEGLTKEVLLKKPDDIYLFAADYFSRLLQLREKGPYKVKPFKTVQSVTKQTPKPPVEKLLVRGASKQLSRQISVRGESPVKKVAPVRRIPVRTAKEEKVTEKNKFVDRRNRAKRSEVTEPTPKQVAVTPRNLQESTADKTNALKKEERSLSSTRRGRSTSRTPRQKSTPTPRKSETLPKNGKPSNISTKDEDTEPEKEDAEKEKLMIPKVPSIEETQEFVKDGKLAVTPPRIIKRPQTTQDKDMISSLIVPQKAAEAAQPKEIDAEVDKTIIENKKMIQSIDDESAVDSRKSYENVPESKASEEKLKNQTETLNKAGNLIERENEAKDANFAEKSSTDSLNNTTDGNEADESNFSSVRKSSPTDSAATDKNIDSFSAMNSETDKDSETKSDIDKLGNSVTARIDEIIRREQDLETGEMLEESAPNQDGEVKTSSTEEGFRKLLVQSDASKRIEVDTSKEEKSPVGSQKGNLEKEKRADSVVQNQKDVPITRNEEERNKVPNQSGLYKKIDLDNKIEDNVTIEDKTGEVTSVEPKLDSGATQNVESNQIMSEAVTGSVNASEKLLVTEKIGLKAEKVDTDKIREAKFDAQNKPLEVVTAVSEDLNDSIEASIDQIKAYSLEEGKNIVTREKAVIKEMDQFDSSNKEEGRKVEEEATLAASEADLKASVNNSKEFDDMDPIKLQQGIDGTSLEKKEVDVITRNENLQALPKGNIDPHIDVKSVQDIESKKPEKKIEDLNVQNKETGEMKPDKAVGGNTAVTTVFRAESSHTEDHTDKFMENKQKERVSDTSENGEAKEQRIGKTTHRETDASITPEDDKQEEKIRSTQKPLLDDKIVEEDKFKSDDQQKENNAEKEIHVISVENQKEDNVVKPEAKSHAEKEERQTSTSVESIESWDDRQNLIQKSEIEQKRKTLPESSKSKTGESKSSSSSMDKAKSKTSNVDETAQEPDRTKERNESSEESKSSKPSEEQSVRGSVIEKDSGVETDHTSKDGDDKVRELDLEQSDTNLVNNKEETVSKEEATSDATHKSGSEIIENVIKVATGGPVDHGVKTSINKFIQNETQHVFVGTSSTGLVKEIKPEFREIDEAEYLKKTSTDSTIIDVINSVINVNNDGPVDTSVKTCIGDFIKSEQYEVFSEETTSESPVVMEKGETLLPTQNHGSSSNKDPAQKIAAQDIINSTVSIANTGQIKDVVKDDINDSLKKENVYTPENKDVTNDDTGNKNTTSDKREKQIEEALKQKTEVLSGVEKRDKEKVLQGRTQAKVDKPIRRIKTVGVIRDENKEAPSTKSRVATADYRTRVKRENEGSTHSIRIKRSDTSKDIIKTDTEPLQDLKKTKDRNKECESSKVGAVTADTGKELDKECDKGIIETTTSSFDVTKLHKEVLNIGPESKKDSYNVPPDVSLKEILAAIKIQALWKGFKARKGKGDILEQKLTETETMTKTPSGRTTETTKNEEVKVETTEDTGAGSIIQEEHLTGSLEASDQIKYYYKLDKAAVLIQRIWRGFRIRRRLTDLKSNASTSLTQGKELVIASVLLPEKPDAGTSKYSESKIEDSNGKLAEAAVTIQRIWRGFKVRRSIKRDVKTKTSQLGKPSQREEERNKEVLKNQADKKTIEEVGTKESHLENSTEMFIKAATTIQRIWRGFKVRKVLKAKGTNQSVVGKADSMKETKTDALTEPTRKVEESSRVEEITFNSDDKSEALSKAVITIQRIWRGFRVRQILKKNQKNSLGLPSTVTGGIKSGSEEEATKTASPKTGYLHLDEKFVRAATLIQKIWRGFKVRKQLQGNEQNSKDSAIKEPLATKKGVTEISTDNKELTRPTKNEDRLVKAVIVIQKVWRGFRVRELLKMDSKTRHERMKREVKKETSEMEHLNVEDKFVKAAIMIQKIWRGFKTRNSLKKDLEVQNDTNGTKVRLEDGHSIDFVPHEKTEKQSIDLLESQYPATSEEFVKAATLIQKIWRGFKVRKYFTTAKAQRSKATTNELQHVAIITEGAEPDMNFAKAAVMVQKLWRGFKVRKILREKNLFGKPIEVEAAAAETIRDAETKDKKSALKIQSLWRGYQVRKNIRVIKNKLEDESTKTGKGKELSDEAILNAATKIQAGVRGYLQRKNYGKSVTKLKSITEEDSANKSISDDINSSDANKAKLSEEQILKAIEDLDKLKVPTDIPLSREIDKPTFCRSNTVQEPEIIKMHSSILFKSASSETIDVPSRDDNNNNAQKHKELTPLEVEVEEAIARITGKPSCLIDAKDHVDTKEDIKRVRESDETFENSSTLLSNKYVKEAVSSSKETETPKQQLDDSIDSVGNENANKNVDVNPLDGIINDKDENRTYERPLSMDSNDSVVTVIYNDVNSEDSEENFLNDVQNKLLDQISGKNHSTEGTLNRFNIDQLRKELEEAGLFYNTDNKMHVRHENSRETVDNDQLLDYLDGFELSTPNHLDSPIVSSTNLPDIKEEEVDKKFVGGITGKIQSETLLSSSECNARDGTADTNTKTSTGQADIEKIKSTLRECEDIAKEINMGFEAALPENNKNQEVEEVEGLSPQLFCGTNDKQKLPEAKISDDVELIKPTNSETLIEINDKADAFEQTDNDSATERSSNQNITSKALLSSGLVHTGELHDSLLLPVPEKAPKDTQRLDNMIVEVEASSGNKSQIPKSRLLHTGELHDTVVVPLPLRIENELNSGIAKKTPLTNSTVPPSTIDMVSRGLDFDAKGLLHTGELHDSLVVPIPIDSEELYVKYHDNSQAKLEDSAIKPEGNVAIQVALEETKLLHTGELHDTVMTPLVELTVEDAATVEGRGVEAEGSRDSPRRQVDSECQTNGDGAVAVQLNEAPAGTASLTSPGPAPVVPNVSGVANGATQAPIKGALPNALSSDFSPPPEIQSMESKKRAEGTNNNKSMEAEAATKIQAGFRGYQVRKQLKLKNGSSDMNNQRRQLRRKSSGRLTEGGRIVQNNKPKDPKDIEEKSAVKIQASVRGFLVRRRQKKQKNSESDRT